MKKRRWVFRAFGVFLAIVAVMVAAAIVLNSAAAASLPFSMALRSKLYADYSQEGSQGVLGAFRLSIIGDALRDLGLSPKEADQQTAGIKIALDDPVPTATALNFEGDDPYTATPTVTPTPTPTVMNTPTNTPRPTKTPLPTSTKKPTTAAPAGDTASPVIADPGVISPIPTALASCSRVLTVTNSRITDAAPSSGIKYVKLKYKVYDNAETKIYAGYIYSAPFSICSGGPTGGGWDACYDGSMTVSISPGFSAQPDYTGPGPFKIKVWLITEDNAGKTDSHFYGYYTMSESCDDPPPPTNTPIPMDTTHPSLLSLSMSPPSGSVLTSCDLIADMDVFDPAFSAGISASGVQIKHTRVSGGDFSQPIPGLLGDFVSGPGSDWVGNATGTITLRGLAPAEPFTLYGVLDDIAGAGPVQWGNLDYTAPSVGCPP